MKVGIIGGGIAGLTCAYRLAQKGIKPVVFEKSFMPGGRLQWSAIVGGEELHPYSYRLMEELGLREVEIRLELKDLGAVNPDGSLLGMENFNQMMESLPDEAKAFMGKLGEFFGKHKIDVKNLSQEFKELHNISFAEYTKDCPESLKPMLGLEINLRWVKDWEKISAAYGLACVAPFFTVIPKEKVYVFEENMIIITNILERKINEQEGQVKNNAQVEKVEKTGKGFKILTSDEETEVEKVVFAVPLNEVEKIMPEIDTGEGIKHTNGKCIMISDGELKEEYKGRDALFVFPGHESNISVGLFMDIEEHRLYPYDKDKQVNLDTLYDSYNITSEKDLIPAWPIVTPGARIPNLKTNIEGVFICGDFYHIAAHDTSVATAEMVAEMIGDKNN